MRKSEKDRGWDRNTPYKIIKIGPETEHYDAV